MKPDAETLNKKLAEESSIIQGCKAHSTVENQGKALCQHYEEKPHYRFNRHRKSSDKTQHPFMIKNSQQSRNIISPA